MTTRMDATVTLRTRPQTSSIPGPVRRIVVPVGGTDREFLAQEQAIAFAEVLGVPVVGVKVTPATDDVRPDLFSYLEGHAARHGVDFESLILAGTDPVEPFLDELDGLDLVVVGSERIGDRHHVDSFVERILRHAPGPVQVVRLGQYD